MMLYSKILKPLIDITAGLLLSAIFLLPTLILMLAVALESKGPPIFKQKRIGQKGREFTIYKIRTMQFNPQAGGTYFTTANDSRITKIGAFLRKSSLDEIPQFWNLLFADMSLIGPRPNVPAQRSLYTDQQWELRHQVRPGITGLSQSTFRSSGTEHKRTRMDLFYASHCCLSLDVLITFRTFKILVKKGVQN